MVSAACTHLNHGCPLRALASQVAGLDAIDNIRDLNQQKITRLRRIDGVSLKVPVGIALDLIKAKQCHKWVALCH